MPKKKSKVAKRKTVRKAGGLRYVVVSNRSYGTALKGTRIYYEGKKPPALRSDGRISLGKNILEALKKRFGGKFRWIITDKTNSITTEYGIVRVRTSQSLLKKMWNEQFDRSRDVKNDIISRTLYYVFPTQFTGQPPTTYVPGTLAKTLSKDIVQRMSSEDKEAVTRFLPEFISSESISAVNFLKASAEIESLRELAIELEREILNNHAESWWQSYIQGKILIIQQGYIKAIEKMNIAVGNTKFPDFSVVTHDNYLDILEIKKPNTQILKADSSRGNYFSDSEISKAVILVENYLSNVTNHAADVRSYILDNYKLDLKVVRPRGIILAGDARGFTEQKQRDDFRLLSQGLKNITIVTYDELLTRLKNYIGVLEQFTKPSNGAATAAES